MYGTNFCVLNSVNSGKYFLLTENLFNCTLPFKEQNVSESI